MDSGRRRFYLTFDGGSGIMDLARDMVTAKRSDNLPTEITPRSAVHALASRLLLLGVTAFGGVW